MIGVRPPAITARQRQERTRSLLEELTAGCEVSDRAWRARQAQATCGVLVELVVDGDVDVGARTDEGEAPAALRPEELSA